MELSIGRILKGYWYNKNEQDTNNNFVSSDKKYKTYIAVDNVTENILEDFDSIEIAEMYIRNRNARIVTNGTQEFFEILLKQNAKRDKDNQPYVLSESLEEQLEL